MVSKRLAFAFVALAAAASTGCRSPAPASIAAWKACVADRTTFVWSINRAQFAPAQGSLLYLHAKWGESSALSSNEYSAGELYIDLPDIRTGSTITFSRQGPRLTYVEGSYEIYYLAHAMVGTARVLRVERGWVELDLDTATVEPEIDLGHRGMIELRGRIVAQQVARVVDCP